MMNRVLVLTNFNAGRKRAIKYKKAVLEFVLKHTKQIKFIDVDELKTTDVSDYDTILVMGGDGTVNKVLPYLINTDKVLGIIPTGTANLLAAKLGFTNNLKKTLEIIDKQEAKKIDLLEINDENCVLRCGFGYDSDIICKTPQSLKNKFGYFAYFIAGILFALRLKKKEYVINNNKIDASCLIFANCANMYRNIISLTDNSQPDDGLIDVFVLKTTNPIIFFIELLLIAFNIRKNSSRAEYMQAKEMHIENLLTNCHIDGEKKKLKADINMKIREKCVNVFYKK